MRKVFDINAPVAAASGVTVISLLYHLLILESRKI